MTSTAAILWETFGPTGLASVAAWTLAVILLVAGSGVDHRWVRWMAALGAATAGLILASATSESIRSIEIDRTAEVLAAEAVGAEAAQEKFLGRAAKVRFAEDTITDRADLAGVTVAEEEGAYERAVAAELEKIPAYRRAGRKQRSGNKQSDEAAVADTTAEPTADNGEGGAETSVRKLPEAQLRVADRFDRINRGLAGSLFLLAAGLVGWEWVRRFNTTFDVIWPVPLAGTVVDGAAAKAHVVVPEGAVQLTDFLSTTTRKGESFVVFTDEPELTDCDGLERFAAGPVRWILPVRSLPAEYITADPAVAEFVFESSWFGRVGFVVSGDHDADQALADLADRLDHRRRCRASARRTLNIVWARPTAPDAAATSHLMELAAPTNIRWVCCVSAEPSGRHHDADSSRTTVGASSHQDT